jgi:hypothetical protein
MKYPIYLKGGFPMSKIEQQISYLEMNKAEFSLDHLLENSSIKDIKEYVALLRKELKNKDKQIKELITENVTMEVKLASK